MSMSQEQRIKAMREALQKYADQSHWEWDRADGSRASVWVEGSEGPDIARAALKATKTPQHSEPPAPAPSNESLECVARALASQIGQRWFEQGHSAALHSSWDDRDLRSFVETVEDVLRVGLSQSGTKTSLDTEPLIAAIVERFFGVYQDNSEVRRDLQKIVAAWQLGEF